MKEAISCLRASIFWIRGKTGSLAPGDRGQIVIPQEARRFFGISPGDTLLILGNEASGLVVTRPEILNNLADEILGKEEQQT